ncbi:MAG: hypothetical protein V4523_13670 [Pseudomonadota bacterium]
MDAVRVEIRFDAVAHLIVRHEDFSGQPLRKIENGPDGFTIVIREFLLLEQAVKIEPVEQQEVYIGAAQEGVIHRRLP